MYILGIFSLIQILFLPGIILVKFFKGRKGFIQSLVYTFALSLIFNHLLVVILTHLGINKPVIHYLLFTMEIFLALYLYWSDLKEPIGNRISTLYEEFNNNLRSLFDQVKGEREFTSILKNVIVALFLGWSVYSILWTISLLISNFGSVFKIWDSVVSWNHWAVEWYSNYQPLDTKRYAQLIPTNFSVTYSFMRSELVQFFAISFMPLFAVYLLLLLFDLGLKKREFGYLIGVVITQYLLKRFYLPLISSGYVDVALMFFTFLTAYTLLNASTQTEEKHLRNSALLGFIFAAGAALTKQNGLWVLAVYPILAYSIIFQRIENITKKERIRLTMRYFCLAVVLLLPWYVFNELRIAAGARTNVLMLMSQSHHSGRTRIDRLIKAYKDLSVYVYLFPFVIFTLPFINRDERKIIVLIMIPYSLIWAFFFSLYPRNLSIGFALLGFASGIGAAWLTDLVLGLLVKKRVAKWPKWIILISLLVVIVLPIVRLKNEELIEIQIDRQRSVLESEVNDLLYEYFERQGGLAPIFTNYPIRYLPGFDDLQIDIGGFEDYDFYWQRRKENPEVEYMLISLFKDNGRVVNEIYNGVEMGLYEIIFKHNKYLFVRILDE